jgi:hypothetical protein
MNDVTALWSTHAHHTVVCVCVAAVDHMRQHTQSQTSYREPQRSRHAVRRLRDADASHRRLPRKVHQARTADSTTGADAARYVDGDAGYDRREQLWREVNRLAVHDNHAAATRCTPHDATR